MRAVVTGGAKRLGKEIAIFLAERGFEVAIHYHSSEKSADELAQYIKSKTGNNCVSIKADLTQEIEVQDLIGRANDKLGGSISCLVNNASIFEYDNIWTANRDSWDRHIESNLRAPFVLTQSFANQVSPSIRDEHGEPLSQGSIINLIDQRVKKLTPEFTSYTIAKMGLWALTKTSAQALAPNIRVNAIAPGWISDKYDLRTVDHEQHPAGRVGRPHDISEAVNYLFNAGFITGQTLTIDGGMTKKMIYAE